MSEFLRILPEEVRSNAKRLLGPERTGPPNASQPEPRLEPPGRWLGGVISAL